MRMSWRTCALFLLAGTWPQFGCHQLPAIQPVQELRPIQNADVGKKQELTAADITQAWIAKADQLDKAGKTADAIALCEKMREPGNPQAWQATKKLALLYTRGNDLDRAEQEFQRLLQQNPMDAEALTHLGAISYQRGHWGIAEKHLRKALALQPDHVYARVNLGMTLSQQGYYDESVGELTKVVSEPEAYCNVAFVMTLQGKPRDAIVAYERALKLEPTMTRANLELAKLRQTDGNATVTLTTPHKNAMVEQEAAPKVAVEGTSRLMQSRPTLPPLSIEMEATTETPTTSKKK